MPRWEEEVLAIFYIKEQGTDLWLGSQHPWALAYALQESAMSHWSSYGSSLGLSFPFSLMRGVREAAEEPSS